jgi:hypothetical protein
MVLKRKVQTVSMDNRFFLGKFRHLAILGLTLAGHGQAFQYTDCPYHIRTGMNPAGIA